MQNCLDLIKNTARSFVVLFVFGISVSVATAGHGGGHGETHSEEFNPTETIMHHISDAHDFHVFGDISVPLPVILYGSKGLDVFMSSGFHHGTRNVVTDKAEYIINHEKIYIANADGKLDLDEEGHANNEKPLDLSITKNVFSMLLSVLVLGFAFTSAASGYKKRPGQAPKGFQNLLETLIVFVRDEIVKPNIAGDKYQKFMPYLLSVFFFIWLNNLIGLIPFFPFSSNLTGNIAFTLVLAVFTFIMTNINGTKDYWMHILWMPGVPLPLKPLMAVLEIIGMFTKPFALMLRLFANITAGHIIILSLICIIFINKSASWAGLSVPLVVVMSVLELLVAFLQAYVFTLLSALFIGQAVEDHDHH